MAADIFETHRNARVYAAGKPSLERIMKRLAQRPAYPAELRRLARLTPRGWGILWDELERSGLLTKERSQRLWRLRSDRELVEQWRRLDQHPLEIEVTPRVYARCSDVPKFDKARLWEHFRRGHIDWSSPLECPFCGHRFSAPRSGFWRRGLRIQSASHRRRGCRKNWRTDDKNLGKWSHAKPIGRLDLPPNSGLLDPAIRGSEKVLQIR